MSFARVLSPSSVAATPWKNGLGVTRELYRRASSAADFSLRISVADVTSNNAFSQFVGIERLLALYSGAGARIVAGADSECVATLARPGLDVLHFDGEVQPIRAELIDGGIRDFNVMFAHADFALGAVYVTGDECFVQLAAHSDAGLLRMLREIGAPRQPVLVVPPGDVLIVFVAPSTGDDSFGAAVTLKSGEQVQRVPGGSVAVVDGSDAPGAVTIAAGGMSALCVVLRGH